MDTVASWTRNLCLNMSQDRSVVVDSNCKSETSDNINILSSWSVLDIGTGNGLLLHELAKQGYDVECCLFLLASQYMPHGVLGDTTHQKVPCLVQLL